MDNCQKYREWISALVDDELSEDEKASLTEHMNGCPDCAEYHTMFSYLHTETSQLAVDPPKELSQRVMHTIQVLNKKPRFLSRFKFTAAAAIIAIILFAASSQIEHYFPCTSSQNKIETETPAESVEDKTNESTPKMYFGSSADNVVPPKALQHAPAAPKISQQHEVKPYKKQSDNSKNKPNQKTVSNFKQKQEPVTKESKATPTTPKNNQPAVIESKKSAPTPPQSQSGQTEGNHIQTKDASLTGGSADQSDNELCAMMSVPNQYQLPNIPYKMPFARYIIVKDTEVPSILAMHHIDEFENNRFIQFDMTLHDKIIAELASANLIYTDLMGDDVTLSKGLFIILND